MIIIFVEFIDQLIDYPINCANFTQYHLKIHYSHVLTEMQSP